VTASVDPPATTAKPAPAVPVVAPVAATAPAVLEKKDKPPVKQDKQAATAPPPEPGPAAKPAGAEPQDNPAQPSSPMVTSKSMIGPPDPAAGKLIEPTFPPKTVNAARLPEIAAIAPKVADKAADEKVEEAEVEPIPATPELATRHTEFGVDVGGANSVTGLRALWRGLLKSRANAALTTLHPVIAIKENNSGLGMQLRLVAGPINDAAAAAKICASLTVSERGCSTTVFEGQRLTMNADDQAKADAKTASEAKSGPEARPDADSKQAASSKGYMHRHYATRHQPPPQDDPPPAPKDEPSTLSLIFGKH
jgi:hypothetical protein